MSLRIAIATDEVGWHTRQLQAALRERGAVGRCVDLEDCRIDTTAASRTSGAVSFSATSSATTERSLLKWPNALAAACRTSTTSSCRQPTMLSHAFG